MFQDLSDKQKLYRRIVKKKAEKARRARKKTRKRKENTRKKNLRNLVKDEEGKTVNQVVHLMMTKFTLDNISVMIQRVMPVTENPNTQDQR